MSACLHGFFAIPLRLHRYASVSSFHSRSTAPTPGICNQSRIALHAPAYHSALFGVVTCFWQRSVHFSEAVEDGFVDGFGHFILINRCVASAPASSSLIVTYFIVEAIVAWPTNA
jgi:hypothetical protein